MALSLLSVKKGHRRHPRFTDFPGPALCQNTPIPGRKRGHCCLSPLFAVSSHPSPRWSASHPQLKKGAIAAAVPASPTSPDPSLPGTSFPERQSGDRHRHLRSALFSPPFPPRQSPLLRSKKGNAPPPPHFSVFPRPFPHQNASILAQKRENDHCHPPLLPVFSPPLPHRPLSQSKNSGAATSPTSPVSLLLPLQTIPLPRSKKGPKIGFHAFFAGGSVL